MLLALLLLLAALLLAAGFEMLLVMGLPAVLAKLLAHPNMPDAVIAQRLLAGVEVVTLLAIPFFLFAGELMARGRMAEQLAELFRSVAGHWRGGVGHSTVATFMVFGAAAGSAPATVAALGRLTLPELRASGFSERFSLGLIASSAECALLIPPSITFVVYSWLTGTSIAALFAAGLVVGIVLGLAFMALVAWHASLHLRSASHPRRGASAWLVLPRAGWVIGMQLIILGGIFAGIFTATEAAAVSVLYAIIVEWLWLRAITWQAVMEAATDSAVASAALFILLGIGSLLGYLITLENFHAHVARALSDWNVNWVLFLLFVNAIFLIAGMFIDPNSIMLLLVPILFPAATALGVDPVHFGMVVTLNVCIAMITPPFGMDLFITSSTLNKPVETVVAGIWPFVGINLLVLAVISYLPGLSTSLPRLLLG
jgi:C4-dicarboxylate transporter DctM subunit